MVLDARTGEVLHSRNADTRLHPASLTKMMTLYVVFDAIRRGEITLETKVKISRKAAAEQPSKLGLKAGQRIALRYLIRGASVKSANDAATALGEAISGSEAAFARRMNAMAKALGMTNTTFKNAHGLTENGHMSTARDMTTLGRHLIYDYPQYYNLFSRQTTHAGVKQVSNTNRRLLQNYKGADGIKTGYTRAAGFNLVASAERGNERVIATVFGGTSSAARNARVAELLDLGFKRAPSRAKLSKPRRPVLGTIPAQEPKVIKVAPTITARSKSPRPLQRPDRAPSEDMLLAIVESVDNNVINARNDVATRAAQNETLAGATVTPVRRPQNLVQAAIDTAEPRRKPAARRIVTRASTSGGRHWSISLGRYTTRNRAERLLLKTALQEIGTLDDALRKVVNRPRGWEANFVGLSQSKATLACQRLNARGHDCEVRGPGA
ncbi:D-alanyl-D-alanine carboxypeptidase family protein [uncultured Litoreibacter sp.]|uniref:D-alanyl-D-alanine carboxypeptidase family protein n=1 Tax=uncultured Litoreibacter sp. TaxID=1392394 RepID=UPI002630F75D|nr:D-alanyl-D-alanine carboxypeptidase family protein [uncultured Litoreibacter sp.]